jgi:type III restriction enzyme
LLNTASFYIRADERRVFEDVLTEVKNTLASDIPELSLTVTKSYGGRIRPIRDVLKKRTVPIVSVDSTAAQEPIKEIERKIPNFAGNKSDTRGKGGRIQVLQTIGLGTEATEEWVELEHSNPVTARWVFLREIQKLHRRAAHLCDIDLAKFDAMIEYSSPAAELIRDAAEKIVDAYIEHSVIVQNTAEDPYEIGPIPTNPAKFTKFNHAVHEGYSDLNKLEKEFADAIDATRRTWCRNPSQGGFEIPLLDRGSTKTFNPDFLVWCDRRVLAIDTKADHLIVEDAARKLFFIESIGGGPKLEIRLVTRGKWHSRSGEIGKDAGSTGFTVWSLRNGKVHPTYCSNARRAVDVCIGTAKNSSA